MDEPSRFAEIAYDCGQKIADYEIDQCCGDNLHVEGMQPFIEAAIEKAVAQELANLAQAFESIHNAIVFGSRDWGVYDRDAWIYGIVAGWDEDDGSAGEATREICRRHKIKPEDLERMRSMHRSVTAAREALPESMCPIKMARERLDADRNTATN